VVVGSGVVVVVVVVVVLVGGGGGGGGYQQSRAGIRGNSRQRSATRPGKYSSAYTPWKIAIPLSPTQ
jgi:hypothetical protein